VVLVLGGERHARALVDLEALADLETSSGVEEREPAPIPDPPEQQGLDPAARVAEQGEARGEDPGLVQPEGFAAEEVDDLRESPVLDPAVGPAQDEEARGVAAGKGLLGDELLGQGVIEVGGFHLAKAGGIIWAISALWRPLACSRFFSPCRRPSARRPP
jgi:hypothetical protein